MSVTKFFEDFHAKGLELRSILVLIQRAHAGITEIIEGDQKSEEVKNIEEEMSLVKAQLAEAIQRIDNLGKED
jgi:hypothetical protein